MVAAESKHYTFYGVEFYAQRGLVTLIDVEKAADSSVSADQAIRRISPGEFMMRAITARMGLMDWYPDIAFEGRQFLEAATAVAKHARSQGDPTDPKVLEHVGRHLRRSSILTPGDLPPMTGAVAPGYRLRPGRDFRSTMIDGDRQVTPDVTIPRSQEMTPARAEATTFRARSRRQRRRSRR